MFNKKFIFLKRKKWLEVFVSDKSAVEKIKHD